MILGTKAKATEKKFPKRNISENLWLLMIYWFFFLSWQCHCYSYCCVFQRSIIFYIYGFFSAVALICFASIVFDGLYFSFKQVFVDEKSRWLRARIQFPLIHFYWWRCWLLSFTCMRLLLSHNSHWRIFCFVIHAFCVQLKFTINITFYRANMMKILSIKMLSTNQWILTNSSMRFEIAKSKYTFNAFCKQIKVNLILILLSMTHFWKSKYPMNARSAIMRWEVDREREKVDFFSRFSM